MLFENALAHAASVLPEGRIRLVITQRPHCLHLVVKDQGPLPGRTPAEAAFVEGGGLARVDEVSTRWG